MRAIAEYDDLALPFLKRLIDNPNTTLDGKMAGLYTIHLIGRNGGTGGRYYEEFLNPIARGLLLKYLSSNEEGIRYLAMGLLKRAPWLSDIPVIMDVFKNSDYDCWEMVNCLVMYDIVNGPLQGDIPEEIRKCYIYVEKEHSNDIDIEKVVLNAIKEHLGGYVSIEASLFKTNLNSKGYWFRYNNRTLESILELYLIINDRDYLYCSHVMGNRLQYFVENDVIHFCSSETAKQRWIAWWETQSKSYKNELKSFRRIKSDLE